MMGCGWNCYVYGIEAPVICRATWGDEIRIWKTDECGDLEDDIEVDVDMLIENIKTE